MYFKFSQWDSGDLGKSFESIAVFIFQPNFSLQGKWILMVLQSPIQISGAFIYPDKLFGYLCLLGCVCVCVHTRSVTRSCLTLCDPMDCSTPGLPVHHQLPEFTQTRVHWVSDTIQPSHPLSSPSPPALNLSQHQGLFQWVSPSHQVAKVLEFQLQHQSFQWTHSTDFL